MLPSPPHPICPSLLLLVLTTVVGVDTGRAQHLPSLEAVRIGADEAPRIDGDLSDPAWKKAALISGLTQQYPIEQASPTERTEIRLCYDERNLYVAFRCYDSEPDRINASIMQRDQSVGPDDYVAVLLDPFETGREGFYFRLNANGAKGDGRITELSNRVQMDWDAIWWGDGRKDAEGWTVEFAIPFRSLSFPKESPSWRINFNRWIPRKQERNRWSAAYLSRRFTKLDDAGILTGLSDMKRGLGVDVKPYALGQWNSGTPDKDGSNSEFGGDIFWQITPSLTSTLTFNTDFAEAEVDDRVVNLTRFPLFFPEKRDFFLEGSEHFEFGPYSTSLRAFHSRNIGLSDEREKVPILGGFKVTGRQGPVGIGILGTALDGTSDLVEDENFVTRFTLDAGRFSRFGVFASGGDPRGNGENEVYGIDYSYKNPHFIEEQTLEVNLYELMSEDDGDSGHAFGMEVDYPNDPIQWRIDLRQIDEEFRPGLGFVRRPGTRRGQGRIEKTWYPEEIDWIQKYEFGTSYELTTTLDNEVESMEWEVIEFQLETPIGDEWFLFPQISREVLFENFEISDGVVLAPGDYRFNDLVLGMETSTSRPVSFELSGRLGEFWDGDRWGVEGEVEWRQSKYFGVETGAEFDSIDLPAGEFEVLVGFAGFRVTPTPRFSWNVLAQWDNVSDELGINSRVRWILAPGKDAYFVVNRGYDVLDDRSFRSLGTETIAKLGWTFRF